MKVDGMDYGVKEELAERAVAAGEALEAMLIPCLVSLTFTPYGLYERFLGSR